jgi:hypothetical protein
MDHQFLPTELAVPDAVPSASERFELVYDGPDVSDGTMNARELAEVLTGLTRAFSIVSTEVGLEDRYQLRVIDVESNSFHLIIDAIEFAKSNPGATAALAAGAAVVVTAATNSISGAYRIVTDIAKLIDAKKRVKGSRVATLPASFTDDGVVLSIEDELIILTKEQYELLLSKKADRQLSQIVSPLSPKRIETFQIRRGESQLVSVNAGQKDHFDFIEVTEEKSREGTQIVGTFNSLSKNNLRGTFYTIEGVHVPYRYVGGDVGQLFRGFSAREPLRVVGRVKYGSDGVPSFVEVQEIQVVQSSFLS